jgi:hypothetical protein
MTDFSHSLSLQATPMNRERARDGVFLRRSGYGGQARSAFADDVISPACLTLGRIDRAMNVLDYSCIGGFGRFLCLGHLGSLVFRYSLYL